MSFNERLELNENGYDNYGFIMNKILSILETKLMEKQKFIDIMAYISITFKGITLLELFELTGITIEEWHLALTFFKAFFNCYKDILWSMSNDTLKRVIATRYLHGKTSDGKLVLHQYHLNLGNQMNKTSNSIRKLEEQTINYFFAQEYHLLKQTISDIENFLILFNPYTKYDLCRYWQYLEGQGYDPVTEYNKRLELFDIHFEPKPEDLFITILQISRFFKEFADFETKKTPNFRHPLIRDKFIQLEEPEHFEEEIGDIFAFLKKAGKIDSSMQSSDDEYPPGSTAWVFRQPDQEEGWENLQEQVAMNMKNPPEKIIGYLSNIGLEEEVRRMHMIELGRRHIELAEARETSKVSILSHPEKYTNDLNHHESPLKGHELLNPDIPHQKVSQNSPRSDSFDISKRRQEQSKGKRRENCLMS